MELRKIESHQDKKNNHIDIWSVQNKGILIKGQQKITFEKLSKNNQPLSPQEDAQLKKACQDFESFFLYYLLKQMRQTIPEGGLFPQSRALEFYRDMSDEAIAEKIAESGGIGLSKMLSEQIRRDLREKIYPPAIK